MFIKHVLVWFILDFILLRCVQGPNNPLPPVWKLFLAWLFREFSWIVFFLQAACGREIEWRTSHFVLKLGGKAERLQEKSQDLNNHCCWCHLSTIGSNSVSPGYLGDKRVMCTAQRKLKGCFSFRHSGEMGSNRPQVNIKAHKLTNEKGLLFKISWDFETGRFPAVSFTLQLAYSIVN